jgi:hypothetical protein
MNPYLPDEIEGEERAQIASRRRKFGIPDETPALGIALSGGGIRSATVSLGVFQYLARARLLSRIDYLSSVSGGGYFATFFGSLFLPKDERAKGAQVTPEAIRAAAEAEGPAPKTKWELAAERATAVLEDTSFDGSRMTPLRWLRENGRYLAPTGGGDYLYAVAVAIRNFFGLHYVIGISLVAVFLLAALVRVLGFAYFPGFWIGVVESSFMPEEGGNFWPSAWWFVTVASFALAVVPVGVAFFLAQTELAQTKRKRRQIRFNLPLVTAIGIAVLCFAYAITGSGVARLAATYVAIVALLAVVVYLVTKRNARRLVSAGEPAATTIAQTKLSYALMPPLIVTLTLAAFAVCDTIGQTVYALWTVGAHGKWLAGGGAIALLIPLLKQLLPLVTGSGDPSTKSWVRIPMSALAFVAGVLLFVAVASVWSALTQGIIWRGERPAGDPGCIMIIPSDAQQREVGLDSGKRIVVTPPRREEECEDGAEPLGPLPWLWLFAPLFVISVFTGHGVGFINLSSLQRYYAGHLMRSYLRASLFAEDPDVERDVRNAAREDDITLSTYYDPSSLAPLHFVNVTMNQTVASGSQLVQRDRKGMNIAIGPFGFSVGSRSFVQWKLEDMDYKKQRSPAQVIGQPELSALPRYLQGTRLVVEPLSIGNWCAISGAAFTTGHGKGTTLGLSLLLALTNVRLGYWWNAEVERPEPTRRVSSDPRWVEWLSEVFRTQSYLLNEMFARYYGTRRSHWYLSDGGHFENTAVYELIRRRVPRIIVLDNGRDAEYAFDDLANLVRKARIDLDAEIEFLTSVELSAFVDPSVRRFFGTPEEFGAANRDPVYATLARIRYREAPDQPGMMLVLKPRVAGIEPLDVLNYKQANSDFPQQSTTDQFYDEAQWESYRGLGYWIAEQLFSDRSAAAPGRWVPRRMLD